jgi:hypothetical protein
MECASGGVVVGVCVRSSSFVSVEGGRLSYVRLRARAVVMSLEVGGCLRLRVVVPVFGGGGLSWVVGGRWLGPFVGDRCGSSSSSSRVSVPGRWPSFAAFGGCFRHVVVGVGVDLCVVRVVGRLGLFAVVVVV